MSNQLATLSNLAGALTTATQAIQSETGNECYLRFTKAGEWIYGADETEVESNSEWAVNPESFVQGFQAWSADSTLAGEEYDLVTNPPILKGNLPDVDAEWKKLVGCQLVCMNGADKGLQVLFKTTSAGGVKAVGNLMKNLVERLNSKDVANGHVPVVELNADSYKHKKYGKIYTPELNVLHWSKGEELSADEPEVVEEDVEVEIEEVAEEVTPKRRRRRA